MTALLRTTAPTLALALALGAAGCVPRVVLQARPDPTLAGAPTEADRGRRVNALLDDLQLLAQWYRFEASKNHDKRRWFAVAGTASAFGGAGLAAGTLNPNPKENGRRVMLAAAISTALAGGLFHILPFAHEYHLKETCYREASLDAQAQYEALAARCHDAVAGGGEPGTLAGCEVTLHDTLGQLMSFDPAAPCESPRAHEVEALRERAVRADVPQ